jgi:hypothetical protein
LLKVFGRRRQFCLARCLVCGALTQRSTGQQKQNTDNEGDADTTAGREEDPDSRDHEQAADD